MPDFMRLSIGVIADVHAGGPAMPASRLEAIVDAANALNPDLIVLLGDFAASHRFRTRAVTPEQWSKALGRLLKAYNKGRKFKHTEVAPPWYFVEGVSGKTLPKDDAWTIDLANELDHERSQKGQAPRPTRREKKEGAEEKKDDADGAS